MTDTAPDVVKLIERLEKFAAYFEAIETKPVPYELYYAVKNDGEGSGWSYQATGFGPSDIQGAATTLRAQQERIDALERYAREATIAITGLTPGGSEYFGKRIGDMYTADLPYCVERIRERMGYRMDQLRAEARLAEAREALEPFALVAEYDIGESERDEDFFRPMERHNRAPRLTVGHLRAARAYRDKGRE